MEAWREELYHNGILGQKWGVRNGPPYPLDAGDHSASEKKAGYKKSINSNKGKKRKKRKKSSEDHYIRNSLLAGAAVGIGSWVLFDSKFNFQITQGLIRMGKEAVSNFIDNHTYYKDLTKMRTGIIHDGKEFLTKALVKT
jgi:hypothetical protein